MRIQTRLTFLIIFCFLFLVGALTAFYTGESRRLAGLFRIEAKETQDLFDRVMGLTSSYQIAFTDDYALWDEMVGFLTSVDKEWADANLVETLPIFKLNAIWIYNLSGSTVYSINNLSDDYFTELNLPKGAIEEIFSGNTKSCHFFINTQKGVMEICGSSIHPSLDRSKVTPPAGYFFTGRLWDKTFTGELSMLTLTSVSVDQTLRIRPPLQDPAKGHIIFTRILTGWNNIPVANLHVKSESRPIQLVTVVSVKIFSIFVVVFLGLLFVLAFTLMRWVMYPLNRVVKALSDEDPSYLEGIINKNDELGQMAAMIENFFEQRKALVAEIDIRNKAESALKVSEEKFLKAFRSNPSIMYISELNSGLIIDANETFYRTTGFSKEEVIGHSTVELNILSQKVRSDITRSLLYGNKYLKNTEMTMRTKSGETRTIIFSAEVIRVGGEDIMVAVANDITARKQAEEELQRKMDELERFNKLAVGRELKMLELKAKIEKLESQLGSTKRGGGKDAKA
ncbi:MAG: PAS domain S-box protein [Candidatus Omnitrophica bacterium]|nr:PAS domain S-box protein [Candidatus Omnitrophota bacterium]